MGLLENPLFVTFVLLAWGMAVRYLPQLKDWPNRLIPVMTTLLALLAKLITPTEAHAGGFLESLGVALGWWVVPLQVLLQRGIFETWIKPTLDHFGIVGYPTAPLKPADVQQGHLAAKR